MPFCERTYGTTTCGTHCRKTVDLPNIEALSEHATSSSAVAERPRDALNFAKSLNVIEKHIAELLCVCNFSCNYVSISYRF